MSAKMETENWELESDNKKLKEEIEKLKKQNDTLEHNILAVMSISSDKVEKQEQEVKDALKKVNEYQEMIINLQKDNIELHKLRKENKDLKDELPYIHLHDELWVDNEMYNIHKCCGSLHVYDGDEKIGYIWLKDDRVCPQPESSSEQM